MISGMTMRADEVTVGMVVDVQIGDGPPYKGWHEVLDVATQDGRVLLKLRGDGDHADYLIATVAPEWQVRVG
jgi:hypothetical protein